MSKSLKTNLLAFIALAFVFSSFPAFAGGEGAKKFINDVGNQVLGIISKKGEDDNTKEKNLIGIFNNTVDTAWMSKFVLGKYYRQATPEQMAKYTPLYRQYVLQSYVPKFRDYTGEKFQITNVRQEGNESTVQTEIVRPNQASVRVDYRLVGSGNNFKIVDIIVEGVSLINTQRTEFGSVISREGFDTLISKIEKMVDNYNSSHS